MLIELCTDSLWWCVTSDLLGNPLVVRLGMGGRARLGLELFQDECDGEAPLEQGVGSLCLGSHLLSLTIW